VFQSETMSLAQSVLDACRARGWRLATAESCTGGLVAGALTAIAGSSAVVERGFVTYSNEAKSELLGVSPEIIAKPAPAAPPRQSRSGSSYSAWRGATGNAALNAASSPATARRCGRRR